MTNVSLSSTLEDYLEMIFNIVSRNSVARSMEIAEKLDVKRSTVTVALRVLAEKGLINYEPRSYVTLTKNGEKIAKCVSKRHNILRDLFMEVLGLPLDESDKAACLMEHGMNTNLCKAMASLLIAIRKNKSLAQSLSDAISSEREEINCLSTCDY